MITFLLIASLLLHGISIFAIILLYTRQNRYKETERRIEKLQRELDEAMHSYLAEFKDQNEEISSLLSSLQKERSGGAVHNTDPIKQTAAVKKRRVNQSGATMYKQAEQNGPYVPPYMNVQDKLELTVNETQGESNADRKFEGNIGRGNGDSHASPRKNEVSEKASENRKPKVMMPWEKRAFEMKRNNYPVEAIAKELKKGKTEIELLLKFHS